jgi:hypothetical protein
MRYRRFLAVGVAALASAGLVPVVSLQPVNASCLGFMPLRKSIATAPIVFVGTVTATHNQGRTAVVHVTDVWRGQHVPRTVRLFGSPTTGTAVTSVDRTYTVGGKYLFVPAATRTRPPYDDNNCSATRPYTKALAQYRPAGAHLP